MQQKFTIDPVGELPSQPATLTVYNDVKKKVPAEPTPFVKRGRNAAWLSQANSEKYPDRCNATPFFLIRNHSLLLVLSLADRVPYPTLPTCIKCTIPRGQDLKQILPHLGWPPDSHGQPASNWIAVPVIQETTEEPCSPWLLSLCIATTVTYHLQCKETTPAYLYSILSLHTASIQKCACKRKSCWDLLVSKIWNLVFSGHWFSKLCWMGEFLFQ